MGKTYRPWDPNQQYLLPPSVQDWLPENDLVYFLLDTVNELDISAITQKYEQEKRGFPPFHPRMMAALLVYAYCRGVFSSRKIMQACQERISFKVIVGDDIPDFRTISDFRKLHLKELQQLFVQVLQLCQEAGLVKLGHIALDGTKIKANASRHKAMSYGRMLTEEKRLKEEIEQLLEKAKAIDEQEDNKYGTDRRGDELPEELAHRESRLKRIQEAKRALEAKGKVSAQQARKEREQEDCTNDDKPKRGRKRKAISEVPADNKQYNFTDPESGIMKANNKGWDQCGNVQAAVDSKKQIIVACDVTSQEVEKYTYKWIRDEDYKGEKCFVFERYPVYKNSGYTKQIVWLDQKEYKILRIEFFDRKKAPLKTLTQSDFKQYLGKYWYPGTMHMENHQTGKSTLITWKNYKFQNGLKDKDFNKNSLKRAR